MKPIFRTLFCELAAVMVALVVVMALPTLPPSMYPLYGFAGCLAVVAGAIAADRWTNR